MVRMVVFRYSRDCTKGAVDYDGESVMDKRRDIRADDLSTISNGIAYHGGRSTFLGITAFWVYYIYDFQGS